MAYKVKTDVYTNDGGKSRRICLYNDNVSKWDLIVSVWDAFMRIEDVISKDFNWIVWKAEEDSNSARSKPVLVTLYDETMRVFLSVDDGEWGVAEWELQWDQLISIVSETINAIYDESYKLYRFLNYDGTTVLQWWYVEVWGTPVYTWDTPTRASDAHHDYAFSWWNPAVWPITSNTNYIAQYTVTEYCYATYKNYDNTTLQTKKVVKWQRAEYTWYTPYKPNSSEYMYRFSGWNPDADTPLNEDTTFTAQYQSFALYNVSLTWGSTPILTFKASEIGYIDPDISNMAEYVFNTLDPEENMCVIDKTIFVLGFETSTEPEYSSWRSYVFKESNEWNYSAEEDETIDLHDRDKNYRFCDTYLPNSIEYTDSSCTSKIYDMSWWEQSCYWVWTTKFILMDIWGCYEGWYAMLANNEYGDVIDPSKSDTEQSVWSYLVRNNVWREGKWLYVPALTDWQTIIQAIHEKYANVSSTYASESDYMRAVLLLPYSWMDSSETSLGSKWRYWSSNTASAGVRSWILIDTTTAPTVVNNISESTAVTSRLFVKVSAWSY